MKAGNETVRRTIGIHEKVRSDELCAPAKTRRDRLAVCAAPGEAVDGVSACGGSVYIVRHVVVLIIFGFFGSFVGP